MKTALLISAAFLCVANCYALTGLDRNLIQLPEGAETHYYHAKHEVDWGPFTMEEHDIRNNIHADYCVEVSFCDNEIYIKGLFADVAPDAWIRGEIEGDVVTFPNNQYLGEIVLPNQTRTEAWYWGNLSCPTQWRYDEESGSFSSLLGSSTIVSEHGCYPYLCFISFPQLTDYAKELGTSLEFVCPSLNDAQIFSISVESRCAEGDEFFDYNTAGKMCISEDEFYIQGLCSHSAPEAWVKGYKVDETTVRFPSEQFQCIYIYDSYWNSPLFFGGYKKKDIYFIWDGDNGTLTLDKDKNLFYYEHDEACFGSTYYNTVIKVQDSSLPSPQSLSELEGERYKPVYDLFGSRLDNNGMVRGFVVDKSLNRIIYTR